MIPVEKTLPFLTWLVLWVATLAAQCFAAWSVFSYFSATPYSGVALLVTIAVTQLIKIPLSILRLRAMGRPPDDAILAMVPIGNLGLAWQMVQTGDVSPERRARSEAVWAGEMSAIQAFGHGVSVVGRSAPQVLVLALLGAIPAAAINEYFLMRWLDIPAPPASGDVWTQGAGIITLLLGFYTIFQFMKMSTASRESWIPSVFFVPMLILTGTLAFRGAKGMDQQVRLLASFAPWLVVMSIRGGFLAAGWLALHQQAREGKLAVSAIGDMFGTILRRGPSLIGAHAAVVHAVTIGIQVVIPGIFYSVVYALVDAAAFYEPQLPSLARSQQLTNGIRRRVFKILALSLMVSSLPFGIFAFAVVEPAKLAGAVIDPSTLDWRFWLTWDVLELVAGAISTIAFAAVYEERRRLLTQRVEASPPPAPVIIPTP